MRVVSSETIETEVQLASEDLLSLPNGKDFELVDGQLLERHSGFESSYIASQLLVQLFQYNQSSKAGWVPGCGCGYSLQLPSRTNNVRKPDVSFASFCKLPASNGIPQGYPAIAPDLAAEVLAPNDLASEVESKIGDYLLAGVRLIWVINPPTRTVSVYRQNGSLTRHYESDELSGEDVLPGFSCKISALFEVPQSKT